jgi:hypothetical protein
MQIEILDPKARKLLKNLAEMNLISIRKPADDGFSSLVIKSAPKQKPVLHLCAKLLKKLKS